MAGPSNSSPTKQPGRKVTSTPVKMKNLRMKEKVKKSKSKRGRYVRRRSIQLANKILQEAAGVSLSTSSANTGADQQLNDDETDPEFESISTSVQGEVGRLLSEIDNDG